MPAKWQQWMPSYIDRFHGSKWVQAMHPSAREGYRTLLEAQWQSEDGSLPDEMEELGILSGLAQWGVWDEHAKAILRHFPLLEHGRRRNRVNYELWLEARRIHEARRTKKSRQSDVDEEVRKQSATSEQEVSNTSAASEQEVSKESGDAGRHTITILNNPLQLQEKLRPTALSENSDPERPEEFANAWNRCRGPLPKITQFTDSRRRKVAIRQRQGISLAEFEKAVKHCARTPFLQGDNKQGWRADFDWLIDNDKNLLKVLEGKYDAGRVDSESDEALGELIRQRRAEG